MPTIQFVTPIEPVNEGVGHTPIDTQLQQNYKFMQK